MSNKIAYFNFHYSSNVGNLDLSKYVEHTNNMFHKE